MIGLSVAMSLTISLFMIANFWNISGLFAFLVMNELHPVVITASVFFLIAPLMLYKVAASYLVLFDFNFFRMYGIKLNNQSDKMSILNVSTLFSYFTLPMVNSFYIIALNNDQIAQTTFANSLKSLSYPVINGHSITLYINFIMIPLAIVLAILTSQKVCELTGLAKYMGARSMNKSVLAEYKMKLQTDKEKYINRIVYYYHILSVNERKSDLDDHLFN
jgi:hypothetical protein